MDIKTPVLSNNKSQPSFGTKIKVVSPEFFKYIEIKMNKQPFAMINDWLLKPLGRYAENIPHDKYDKVSYYSGYCLNQKNILTKGIKSCTSGLVLNKGKNSSLAFHVYNDKNEKRKIKELRPFMQGDNAILIGAKSCCNQSLSVFDNFRQYINCNKIPLTYMRNQAKYSYVNLAYFSKIDTLFLSIGDLSQKDNYVKNFKDLKKVFKNIQISPTDSLHFIFSAKELIEKIKMAFVK